MIHFTHPPGIADTAETRLAQTFYLVEANSFEAMTLWGQHAAGSLFPPMRRGARAFEMLDWEENGSGWLVDVGHLGKGKARMPVCISVNWARIEGRWVCLWYLCSAVTDSRQADKWLKANCESYKAGRRCDAMGFRNCISAIREANKTEVIA